MVTSSAIERYRDELLALDFSPVDDDELALIREQTTGHRYNCESDEVYSSEGQIALEELLIELRVPRVIADHYTNRFLREEIVEPTLARQRGREAKGLPAWDGPPTKQKYTRVTWTDDEVAAYRRRWPNHPDPSL